MDIAGFFVSFLFQFAKDASVTHSLGQKCFYLAKCKQQKPWNIYFSYQNQLILLNLPSALIFCDYCRKLI